MRIALDGRAIRYTGIDIYTRALYEKIIKEGEYALLYQNTMNIPSSNSSYLKKGINFVHRKCEEQLTLGRWLSKNHIELFHATMNTDVPIYSKVPVVVTIHDIIPHIMPKYYFNNNIERINYELYIRLAIKRSTHIITISNFSCNELIAQYHVDRSKISVIYNGYNQSFRPEKNKENLRRVKNKYNLPDNYILTIGGSEYRKNVKRLINVFLNNFINQNSLVIIGGSWRNTDLSKEYANEKIVFLSNLPEEDLIIVYNLAKVFVFPSFYEGFGIPVLESMACGIPVITSNISSMPEIGGKAAVYFNPFDEKNMAEKINLVLKNQNLRNQMIRLGLEQATHFSWQKCFDETKKIYQLLIKS